MLRTQKRQIPLLVFKSGDKVSRWATFRKVTFDRWCVLQDGRKRWRVELCQMLGQSPNRRNRAPTRGPYHPALCTPYRPKRTHHSRVWSAKLTHWNVPPGTRGCRRWVFRNYSLGGLSWRTKGDLNNQFRVQTFIYLFHTDSWSLTTTLYFSA